jgi:hypothetical protein
MQNRINDEYYLLGFNEYDVAAGYRSAGLPAIEN